MLSKEEEEAIKRLEKRIKDDENYTLTQVWLTDDVVATNIVLKLITKLQKENEEKDKEILNLKNEINKAWEEWNDLEQGSYEEEIRLKEKIKKKDKIIDLMTEHICNSAIVDDTVCAIKCDCETDINEDCTQEKMMKCTKQYFERKVEDERNI